LVRAALMLLARRADVIFVFAGDGPTLQACQALVPAEQRDTIRFLGQFPAAGQPHVIEDLVDSFDVGVLATFTEGISNTVVEYMVLEKPVVASDGGAMSELLVDGETGFLVPPRDAAQLAARIEQLLDDAGLRLRMGQAGRRRVESAFLLERQVAKFVALYDALVPPGRSANSAS
jgi:glycosyltransferase involved in cell wall biosynthesis